jgi:hypothetical protein
MTSKLLLIPWAASVAGGAIAALFAITLMLSPAYAAPGGYSLTLLGTIPGPAPGGGNYTFDFEPWDINNRGEVSFCADLDAGSGDFGEGAFIGTPGKPLAQIARAGQPAPGGGKLLYCQGPPSINDGGDVGAAFGLDPFVAPAGLNVGVYRFSHQTGKLSAVVVPDITPAPPSGKFEGASIRTSINNRGDIVFAGISTDADIAPGPPGVNGSGLGGGVFKADKRGVISSVVRPGDAAPGGGVFDFAQNPWINDRGDIGFGAHVQGEECIDFGVPQTDRIFCAESIYIRHAASGKIESVAHQGGPAPGGATYRYAFGPVVNNNGDIAFVGDLTPAPGVNTEFVYFLRTNAKVVRVAGGGDPMPGGGHLLGASFSILDYSVNDRAEVAFGGILDTKTMGLPDSGVYVYWHGAIRLVARTSTVVPGMGKLASVFSPGYMGVPNAPTTPQTSPLSGAAINDSGQVFFNGTLTNGVGVLLLAKPHG